MLKGTYPVRLKWRQQVYIAVPAIIILAFFSLKGALLPFSLVLTAIAIMFLCLKNAFYSLATYVLVSVLTVILSGGVDGTMGDILGLTIAAILVVWVIRIRVIDRVPLANESPMLVLVLFTGWSVASTIIGVCSGTELSLAIRDFLSFSPLLLIPVLYARTINIDSNREKQFFAFFLTIAFATLIWNLLHVRASILATVSVHEVVGAHTHETVPPLLFLCALSFLGSAQGRTQTLLTMLCLVLSAIGIIITFRRTLYLATIPASLLVIGFNNDNRKILLRRLLGAFAVVLSIGIYLFTTNRLFRILLQSYGLRFSSSKDLSTDLSALDRYSEWHDAWHASLQSPIIGHGYGAGFRHYLLEGNYHLIRLFTHNSYLFYLFKTGFVGFALFFLAFFLFLQRGLKYVRSDKLSNAQRSIVRAGVAYLVLLALAAITDTYLEHRPALIWVGLFWGYLLSLEHRIGSSGLRPKPCS